MKPASCFTLTTSPPKPTVKKSSGIALHRYKYQFLNRNIRRGLTVKEPDSETGLYYYGARYLDPKTSRWLGADPALGEYIPQAGGGNSGLPGMGGVFNAVNLHVYHYAGNNPVKYVDPDGRDFFGEKPFTSIFSLSPGVGGGRTVESTRQKIAMLAKSNESSKSWNLMRTRESFGVRVGPTINKCNLFVYEMAKAAGADPGLPHEGGKRQNLLGNGPVPPVAADWANPDFAIPGWRVLSDKETAMPGDVAAMITGGVGYTGHVAIVTGDRQTTGTSNDFPEKVRETDWGFRDDQKGKVVFRRWEGVE